MYIYEPRSKGPQPGASGGTAILRPSQVYRYPDLGHANHQSVEFVSFLGDLSGPLEDDIRIAWNARHDRQEIFKLLRQQTAFPLSTSVKTQLRTIFATDADALWLADKLATNGPEPLWPLQDIKDRVAKASKLGTESGNYKATLIDPHPGGTLTGKLVKCLDKLKTSQLPDAFFFPGRTENRALIISGVHGDEQRGVDVVRQLQKLLETTIKAGKKPYFTTIIVPVVIPRTQSPSGSRNVPGGLGVDTKGTLACRAIEPNRNFPLPGEDLTTARARGAGSTSDAELMIRTASGVRAPQDTDPSMPLTSIRMLPETRILISLIERFQPQRLASVHDHSLKQDCHACSSKASKCGGEGPGIFVDPRGVDMAAGTITNTAQMNADDSLTLKMVETALARMPCSISLLKGAFPPFAGNQAFYPPIIRYFSKQRVEGNSLGDWAPVATSKRPGITTLTIEVPKYTTAQAAIEKQVKEIHRDVLRDVFLEP